MKKFISKDEIKRFIKYLKINQEQFKLDDDFKSIIANSTNLNDAYKELGNHYSGMSTSYKNVLFKEDLFEILIKKYDYDFLNALKLIETRPEVRTARQNRKIQNLEHSKKKAINSIEQSCAEIISETSLFNIFTRSKVKTLKKSAIASIQRCDSFSQIE